MSRVKRNIVSILVAASMMSVLFGCGSNADNSDKEKFVGTWETSIDLTDAVNEEIQNSLDAANADIGEYLNINKFELTLLFEFNDDDTYSLYADESSLDNNIEDLKVDFKDGITAYFEGVIADQGLGMSVDDVLATSGLSLDDLVDECVSDDMFDGVIDEFAAEGKWKAENGKLYATDGVDEDFAENKYQPYEFTSDGIKLLKAEAEEDEFGVYPMILKKAE